MNSYADLTTLKSSSYLDISGTGDDTYLRRLLEDAARVIDGVCKRFFYCWEGALYVDGDARRLYPQYDILSVTTLKTDPGGDGTFENSLTEDTDFNLYPLNGFPKLYAQIGYNAAYTDFAAGIPRGVEITGVFGFGDGISATPYSTSGGTGTVATSTGTTLTLSAADLVIAGQTILIGSEQMYVESVSGTSATVKRDVNGTTAATHVAATTIYVYEYPMPIYEACLITAMRVWKRKDSAFMDIAGNPETGLVPVIKGLDPDVTQRLLGAGYLKAKAVLI
jgi:hypothetical protein